MRRGPSNKKEKAKKKKKTILFLCPVSRSSDVVVHCCWWVKGVSCRSVSQEKSSCKYDPILGDAFLSQFLPYAAKASLLLVDFSWQILMESDNIVLAHYLAFQSCCPQDPFFISVVEKLHNKLRIRVAFLAGDMVSSVHCRRGCGKSFWEPFFQ